MPLDDRLADLVIRAIETAVDPMLERIAVAEARLEMKTAELVPVLAAVVDLTKENGVLRERLAVVETKQPVPGPKGQDGADGMGWDDLSVDHDGERGFTVKLRQGALVKDCGTFTIPAMLYRGVWEAKAYDPGDVVTWAGSSWHCSKPTTTKPDSFDGAAYWKLMVKKGRDGK